MENETQQNYVECEFLPIYEHIFQQGRSEEKKLGKYTSSQHKINGQRRYAVGAYIVVNEKIDELLSSPKYSSDGGLKEVVAMCLNYFNSLGLKKDKRRKISSLRYGELTLLHVNDIKEVDGKRVIPVGFLTDHEKSKFFWRNKKNAQQFSAGIPARALRR